MPDSAREGEVAHLTARCCLFTIRHSEILLHCLTLWKEGQRGDGDSFDSTETRSLTLANAGNDDVGNSERHWDCALGGRCCATYLPQYLRYRQGVCLAQMAAAVTTILTHYRNLLVGSLYTNDGAGGRAESHLCHSITLPTPRVRLHGAQQKEQPSTYIAQLMLTSILQSGTSAPPKAVSPLGTDSSASSDKALCLSNVYRRQKLLCGTPRIVNLGPRRSRLLSCIMVYLRADMKGSLCTQVYWLTSGVHERYYGTPGKMRCVFFFREAELKPGSAGQGLGWVTAWQSRANAQRGDGHVCGWHPCGGSDERLPNEAACCRTS
ncbi:LOW QUALITY PROTEIN: sodium stibogluconate resistance protein like [Leishmania braziliensis MHOM/BR/75/M2904]|uniref:Sodium stibogluconate resistance protein like n=1 Tax=Leishmania braziliensis TaxID=5660 RepID=A4HJ75_LEIBR|nr:LOW QUALITY PROTEIN: sodium stibogluconate resistance protein like [Leishmania braziliensis MHOM/BR/75/M2904]CAM42535.2 sodium stibogluconate resistance protein like [Leishmania braziliensis MHOM/BR/75/M2904]